MFHSRTSRTDSVEALQAGAVSRRDAAHLSPLLRAIDSAKRCLLDKQRADGHWCAELQGDTILESEYILLMAFLNKEDDEKCHKSARYLLEQQMPEGGWNNYPDGPVCLSTTVKAYFALKLTGHEAGADYMERARAVILAHGGALKCNSFTRFYLALLGQIPYAHCPSVPVEMILLPRWMYFNIYAMSSWTRTIVIPLSIFHAHKPIRRLPPEQGISELFEYPIASKRGRERFVHSTQRAVLAKGSRSASKRGREPFVRSTLRAVPAKGSRPLFDASKRLITWHNFFLLVDRVLKWIDPRSSTLAKSEDRHVPSCLPNWLRQPLAKLRAAAIRRAAQWLIAHFADSDGVGAIFPPMIYTVIALRCLGHDDNSPHMQWALQQLDDLMIEDERGLRIQPCMSPVWDTALALNALAHTDCATEKEDIRRAIDWLLDKEVRCQGDWAQSVRNVAPGGWFFEYRNAFYPDTDDTAMALMALARTGQAFDKRGEPIRPVERAVNWLLALQNSDGGWAAFDRDINREILEKVPFADHNAMLDPSCPDITARVLEALGHFGWHEYNKIVRRAIAYIERHQDPRGCWIGRWGVNYLYGTWQVLQGLEAIGFDMNEPMIRRAVAWLKAVQQPEGCWGETCRSYDEPGLAGQGNPTASQTAWALLGLIAAGEADSPEVSKGVDWLIATQQADGNWHEEEFTGTGFPKVFYLKYHYYCLYFPLMALARFRRAAANGSIEEQAKAPHYHWRESAELNRHAPAQTACVLTDENGLPGGDSPTAHQQSNGSRHRPNGRS